MTGRLPQETSIWLSLLRQPIDPVWTLVLGWDLRESRRARDELIIAIRNDPAVDSEIERLAKAIERLPYPEESSPEKKVEERKATRQRWFGMIAACVSGLVTLSSVAYVHYERLNGVDYATARGGYERERLDDGSTAELNTETGIRVDMGDTQRDVVMKRGEALFLVAHDKTRPFVVTAGHTKVRAVGTAFTVRCLEDQSVEVEVTEGVVEVMHQMPRARVLGVIPWGEEKRATIQKVSAGHVASAGGGSIHVEPVSAQDLRERLAWREGHLRFSGQTLSDVFEAFNRYNTLRLEIGDASIAGEKVGGTFKATDVESYLDVLVADGYRVLRVTRSDGTEAARVFGPGH